MKPLLLLDCYVDDFGCAEGFVRFLGGRAVEVVRAAKTAPPDTLAGYAGLIITGSAASATEELSWLPPVERLVREARDRDVPVLGVCFGHQVIPRALFGAEAVRVAERSELGWRRIELTAQSRITDGLPRGFTCFVSHFDEVTPAGDRLRVVARSQHCDVQAYRVPDTRIWGVQFHPEMPLEEAERLVRKNLARHACIAESTQEVLAAAVDGAELGRCIFGNFLAVVDEEPRS